MPTLAGLAHPERGVRFTAFAFVRWGDVVLEASEIAGALTDPKVRDWGPLGESDERIKMTFAQYVQRFVYDADFAAHEPVSDGSKDSFESRSFNIDVLRGDLRRAFPKGVAFEFRHPATSKEVDWRVLRVVCEERAGTHHLVGVVHSELTP
jgi:hypothetical protein